jgi:hypothetical protein
MSSNNLPVVQLADVRVSLYEQDHTFLQCLINRAASRGSIVQQLDSALSQFAPYRDIDPQVFKGVQLVRDKNLSFAEASRQLCGDTKLARRIRYWYHEMFGSSDVRGSR